MKKTKDGKMIPKYKEDDVDDVLLQSVLKQCYTIFRVRYQHKIYYFSI